MSEFLSMGGYAIYVWTSYAVVAGVLTLGMVMPMRTGRALRRRLRIRYRQGRTPSDC